jgi:hypothetical protein
VYDPYARPEPVTTAPAPATPRRRGSFTLLLLAGVLAFLIVAAGVILFITRGDSPAAKVVLPEQFAGYQLLHNDKAHQLQQRMEDAVVVPGLGKAFFSRAAIGAYARNTGDQPALVVIVLPHRTAAALGSDKDDDIARQLLSGAGSNTTTYPSGPLGGVVRCGTRSDEGEQLSLCGWSDGKTAGLAAVGLPKLSAAQTAELVNGLRATLG